MSHISQMKTAIKLPVGQPDQLAFAKGLLNQALMLVANQHQRLSEGEVARLPEPARLTVSEEPVRQYYFDWRWNKHNCEMAVFVAGMPRGLGLTVAEDTGAVGFIGDFYGTGNLPLTLQGEIVQVYTTLAVKTAMERLGYATRLEEIDGGSLAVRGQIYA